MWKAASPIMASRSSVLAELFSHSGSLVRSGTSGSSATSVGAGAGAGEAWRAALCGDGLYGEALDGCPGVRLVGVGGLLGTSEADAGDAGSGRAGTEEATAALAIGTGVEGEGAAAESSLGAAFASVPANEVGVASFGLAAPVAASGAGPGVIGIAPATFQLSPRLELISTTYSVLLYALWIEPVTVRMPSSERTTLSIGCAMMASGMSTPPIFRSSLLAIEVCTALESRIAT